MSSMAEVIYKTRWVDGIRDGSLVTDDAIANALTAAGFGDVREAKAQALEEAAAKLDDKRLLTKPFHEYYPEWLRARAAAVRGEG